MPPSAITEPLPARPPVPSPASPAAGTAVFSLPTFTVQHAALNFADGRDAGLPPAVPQRDGCLNPLLFRDTEALQVAFPCDRYPGISANTHPWRPLNARRAEDERGSRDFGEAAPAAGMTPAERGEIPGGCPSASSREGHAEHTHSAITL